MSATLTYHGFHAVHCPFCNGQREFGDEQKAGKLEVPPIVEAHIRANPTLAPATIEALSEMIRVAYQNAPEIIARNP